VKNCMSNTHCYKITGYTGLMINKLELIYLNIVWLSAVRFLCLNLNQLVVFIKGIVHFSYLKGIQDVGVFVSAVVAILIFLGQTVRVCQSYNGGLWSPRQRACTEKSKLNMI